MIKINLDGKVDYAKPGAVASLTDFDGQVHILARTDDGETGIVTLRRELCEEAKIPISRNQPFSGHFAGLDYGAKVVDSTE